MFHVRLHEVIVGAPIDAACAHGGLLGPGGDLVRVQIMQVEPVDHRLLHLLMQNEEAVGFDDSLLVSEYLRHMAVDVDNRTVHAVAGEIGDVVVAIEFLDAAHDGVQCPLQH